MLQPRFLQLHAGAGDEAGAEAAAGLSRPAAVVPPKYFYDALGSRLFDAITELPEYYPTRTEAAIFAGHGPAIARAVRELTEAHPVIVDLGAGNCAKGAALFPLLAPSRYVAVDISASHLAGALATLQRAHPELEMVGVGLDFSQQLVLPEDLAGPRALVFYPGSSIGNFDRAGALALLRQARDLAGPGAGGGALLVGVDLVKPAEVLEAAYDDPLGVTAAFNLNLLRHLNALLGADFDVRQWQHVARYDPGRSCIEMHLQARAALTVHWRGGQRRFAAGERIHTEDSFKWTPEGFAQLLLEAGWRAPRHWTDERGWFALFVAAG